MRTKATTEGAAIPFLSVSVAWTRRMSPEPPRTSGPSSPCNDDRGGSEAAVSSRFQKSQADERRHRLSRSRPEAPSSAASAWGQRGRAAGGSVAVWQRPGRPSCPSCPSGAPRAWRAGTGQISPGRWLGLGRPHTNGTRAHCSEDTKGPGSGGHGASPFSPGHQPTGQRGRKGCPHTLGTAEPHGEAGGAAPGLSQSNCRGAGTPPSTSVPLKNHSRLLQISLYFPRRKEKSLVITSRVLPGSPSQRDAKHHKDV